MGVEDLTSIFVNGRTVAPKKSDPPGTLVKVYPNLQHYGIALNTLAGKRIAIDMFGWLYANNSTAYKNEAASLRSHTDTIDNKAIVSRLINNVVNLCYTMAQAQVLPIFVIDGDEKDGKMVREQRTEQRDNYRAKMATQVEIMTKHSVFSQEYTEALTLYKKYLVASSSPDQVNVLRVAEVLDSIGIPCVYARGDAEQTCCMMVNCGVAEAVLSPDSDCLAFGAAMWIRDLNSYDSTMTVVYRDQILNYYGISHEVFKQICVCLGTDYNARIPGLGPVGIIDIVTERGSIMAGQDLVLKAIERAAMKSHDKEPMYSPQQWYNYHLNRFNYDGTMNMLRQQHFNDTTKKALKQSDVDYRPPTVNMQNYLEFYGMLSLSSKISIITAIFSTLRPQMSAVRQPHDGVPPFFGGVTAHGVIPVAVYQHPEAVVVMNDEQRNVATTSSLMNFGTEMTIESLFS